MAGVIPLLFTPALPHSVPAPNVPTPGERICAPSHVSSSNTLQRQQIHELKALVHPGRIMAVKMLPFQVCLWWVWGSLGKKLLLLRKSPWSVLLEVNHLTRAPFPECLFCPNTSSPMPLCSESLFFYFLWGDNSPYGALKCHVSVGVTADNTTITRTKAASVEERHRYVVS